MSTINEDLFVEPSISEHTEMYVKAVWLAEESGETPARISSISKILNVAPPSVVEMLKKLEKDGYIQYLARKGVKLTSQGRRIGKRMARNTRLVESLMNKTFRISLDERVACGLEHHMSEEFADALCTLLNHPRTCPHGYSIPKGKCCRRAAS